MTYEQINQQLSAFGMQCRGGFLLGSGEVPGHSGSLVLIGNAGPEFWRAFRASPEGQQPDTKDPLDSWTRRVLDALAGRLDAVMLYPFDGPPYHPFQQWAMRAEAVAPSPIGPLLHPVYGLWHAYRGALVTERSIDFPAVKRAPSPCESCSDKPCLSACPVAAFQPDTYNVPACIGHLASEPPPRCRSQGCLARHACPVGQSYAYGPDHARFHMDRFIDSQPVPDK